MVRVRGPSLAQAAAGGLGQTLIFSQSKGRCYVKRWAAPANPKSGGQLAVRACTQFISQQWHNFTTAEQATWNELAAQTNIPAYNACLAYNLERARRYLMPTAWNPADGTGATGSFSSPVLLAVGRQAKFQINITEVLQNFCFVLFKCPSGTYGQQWDRIVHYIPVLTTGIITYFYGPLPKGQHWFSLNFSLRHGLNAGATYNRTCTIV